MKLIFPKKLELDSYIALSGGADSMSLLYSMIRMGKAPKIAHFIHDDPYARIELAFVMSVAKEYNLELELGYQQNDIKPGDSKEKVWRDERYKFFHSLNKKVYVGTNLDDAIEWYLMTCLRGEGHYMDYSNRNVEKPLLLTSKKQIYDYLRIHVLDWIEDPSNLSGGLRSKIRHELLPIATRVDPGLPGMVRKRLVQKILQSGRAEHIL